MRRFIVLSLCVLWACESTEETGDPEPVPSSPTVTHSGQIRAIFAGDWQANADLQAALRDPDTYAIGALSDLRGEFIATDGTIWIAYPTADALPRVAKVEDSDETATLLVAATVSRWRELPLTVDVAAADVESELRRLAAANGVDVTKPFPFLIRGSLRNVGWHVVDGMRVEPGTPPDKNAQKGMVSEAEGTVVGFYSTQHQGVFTMMGTNVHMHVALADDSLAGHVQTIELVAGATVSLPR